MIGSWDDWAARLQAVTDPLPGRAPYVNTLRVGVSQRFEGLSLLDFLLARHPAQAASTFLSAHGEGRLRVDGRPMALDASVRAGQLVSFDYLEAGEPEVGTEIAPLFEDADVLAVGKPAPLAVHPSGRYNRHCLIAFLHAMFPGQQFRPVHRLDADTTGVVVLAKSAAAARDLARQFRERSVGKIYLAQVHGRPCWEHKTLVHHIGVERLAQGTRAAALAAGEAPPGVQLARCLARVCARSGEHSLLQLRPETGRTHQLRLQLAEEGHPIVSDAAYGKATHTGGTLSGQPLHLHALRLELDHPTSGAPLVVEAPAPAWAHEMAEPP